MHFDKEVNCIKTSREILDVELIKQVIQHKLRNDQ